MAISMTRCRWHPGASCADVVAKDDGGFGVRMPRSTEKCGRERRKLRHRHFVTLRPSSDRAAAVMEVIKGMPQLLLAGVTAITFVTDITIAG